MTATDLAAAVAAVARAIDDTERDWGELPFFVRPMVRRGFTQRTGRDVAGWRALLAAAARGTLAPELPAALAALIDNYRGAPERARKGMGGSADQVAAIEARLRPRIEAAEALRARLTAPTA
ncbi:MAG: hypothetical protein IPL61_39425 [Myxococcales bacterium]|nr:hypothetical protein [Myxococcales bacterium]